MEINPTQLLQQSDVLLLFTVLAFGLLLGKISLGSFEIGSTAGVLLVALLFGHWGFDFNVQTERLGFMLFIFCVGIEAGPNFFSNFAQDGVRYIAIAMVVALTGVLVTVAAAHLLQLEPALAAGMLAGSLTSTPTLVGAQDAATLQAAQLGEEAGSALIGQISVGYAMTYVVGLVGLLSVIRYFPGMLGIDLAEEARKVASERGLGSERRRNVRTPVLRAYEIRSEIAAEIDGRTLRELGLHERRGLIVERIKRDGKLLEADSETVIKEGDRVALVGYPVSHKNSPLLESSEVYDPDLLEFVMDEADVVVSRNQVVGRQLGELQLESEYGCLVDGVTRAQVELPLNRGLVLNRGDVLAVSGERSRLQHFASKIGFISERTDVSDLMSFSFFFILGLIIAQLSLVIADTRITLGNAGGLLVSGILMGYFRARNPAFGHIPQGAINMLKDLGLNIFMVGVGLSAGAEIVSALMESGLTIVLCGALIMLLPVLTGYFFGSLVLKMNPALLLGAITGSMTSTPALKTINDMTRSSIPALGYAGTYTFANVFLTLGGASIASL
jgi:putative transport protein